MHLEYHNFIVNSFMLDLVRFHDITNLFLEIVYINVLFCISVLI